MFSKETYIKRRNQLKKDIGNGILLFPGNNESPMNYADNTFHFRQDSTFLYFFGVSHPNLAAIIDCESGEEIVFGDDYTIDDVVWMGKQPSIADRFLASGIQKTRPIAQLGTELKDALTLGRKIHFLPPYRPENKIKIFELLEIPPSKQKEASSLEFVKAVIAQRNYKSPEEIAEIEKAVNVSGEMHISAMKMLRPGMRESEIAAEMIRIAEAAGGHISFPVIATINGQTLHNHYHGNITKPGQLFLLDCGAETEMGYAGDMSSTFPVDQKFTKRQKEIYQVALNSHEAAIKMLKPGIPFKEIYYQSAREILRGMESLGFFKGDIDEAVAEGVHAMFFPCGLGHMMGLDVHDMEDLGEQYVGYDNEAKSTQFGAKSLRLGRKLEPGFVLTIEPGIYFIPDLIDKWRAEKKFTDFLNYEKLEAYKDFGGCRNEEDFLITETGYRLLGKPIPKTIEEVEALR
ncbi:MAG: aminopeptidase P family protein [Bacteroidales bacterium]|nr:aminopeptidase P family protein [Bacteroidales bacterium]